MEKKNEKARKGSRLLVLAFLLLGNFFTVVAQLRGSHLLGFSGLQSGTQSPPGLNMVFLPMYLYHTNKLMSGEGDKINVNVKLTSYANGIGPAWVTNVKVLGANLGGSALVSFYTNRIEAARTTKTTHYSFSDLFVQPIQLGWHNKKADYLFAYQVYIPTGHYEVAGSNNSGLGQWGHELVAGTTQKFGAKKASHFSIVASYEFNSKKKDSEIQTGDNLSLEGGLGHTWFKKTIYPTPTVFNAGMIYYVQFKTTDDRIPTTNPLISILAAGLKRDRVYGLGAEGNVFIPSIKSAFVLRWVSEFGAVSRFQGATYLIMWVLNLKSFQQAGR